MKLISKLAEKAFEKKYEEYKNILEEVGIEERDIPSYDEFVSALMLDEEGEQDAADTLNPLYDVGTEGIGVGSFVEMGTGGDMGHGSGGGEGPGGVYSLLSVDYPRSVASKNISKRAGATYGSLIKAKCPKCKRWVTTTTARYVVNDHKVKCPKHGWVKPKKFRLRSLADLVQGKI